ncbi:MAG: hypothetical protein JW768_02640 [Chitinispirillaceae bacterium]|nr:hypothetical protein [Chitinispirillaceae bacterium]
MGVDEDGNFFFLPIIIGVAMGAYQGYQIAKANRYASGSDIAVPMLLGAMVGGLAGASGAAISGAGFYGSGTPGLAASSTINSAGMTCLSDRKTPFTTNLGFGAMNWNENKFMWANPFQSNKSFSQRAMDVGGWLTPIGDIAKTGYKISNKNYKHRPGYLANEEGYYKTQGKYTRKVGAVAAERFRLADQMMYPETFGNQQFTGPGPLLSEGDLYFWSRMAKAGIPVGTNSADYQALLHDLRYVRAGATGGAVSAFADQTVVLADWQLSLGSFVNIITRNNNNWSSVGWNAGQAVLFGAAASAKTASLLNASNYNY